MKSKTPNPKSPTRRLAIAERVVAEMESGAMAAAGAEEVSMRFTTEFRRKTVYRQFEVQVSFTRTED
jgi:hypothetical protein